MTAYYIDTAHLVAVVDPRDSLRPRALRLAAELAQDSTTVFYTCDAVLVEFLTFMSNRGPLLREKAAAYIDHLRQQRQVIIVPQTPALFEAAFDLYRRRSDKTYSMVDCIGMVVCHQQSITDVLTADRDFAQEGLTVLLA